MKTSFGRQFCFVSGLLLIITTLVACNTIRTNPIVLSDALVCPSNHSLTTAPIIQWACRLNTKDSLAAYAYKDNAVNINARGKVITGNESIAQAHIQAGFQVASISTLLSTEAFYKFSYEIGKFTDTKGQDYRHLLIIGRSQNFKRELEFIAKAAPTSGFEAQINAQRKKWIALCNKHNAANLVNQLYTENTIYYNHRPVIVGREAVSREYAYMNNPNYSLNLSPILLEVVNDTLAFEIGQCSGSYNGKYMLVWQKNSDGIWRVLMDSNI